MAISKTITLVMDGKIPIQVDEEEFELIKMMVHEAGADLDRNNVKVVVRELRSQGYSLARATILCSLARREFSASTTLYRL